ncbi:hypothetical protein BGZ63DRAFT_462998 [Mariannaea sp. PMI_226]|nr:hypothetical protein BGZ63DRAFT_462998 [Mariannaea sp. PMI_226]
MPKHKGALTQCPPDRLITCLQITALVVASHALLRSPSSIRGTVRRARIEEELQITPSLTQKPTLSDTDLDADAVMEMEVTSDGKRTAPHQSPKWISIPTMSLGTKAVGRIGRKQSEAASKPPAWEWWIGMTGARNFA